MGESSALPGVLFRFRENSVNVFPCNDPAVDLKEPGAEGDIELYKLNYAIFCQHVASVAKYFNLRSDAVVFLTNATRRSEFRCRDEYLLINLRYPVFESDTRTFQIYSTSLIVMHNRLLLIQPDNDTTLFEPALTDILSGDNNLKSKSVPHLLNFMSRAIFQQYTNSMEVFGDVMNKLEEDIMDCNHQTIFMMTTLVRKQNIFLQQTILPLKEMIFNMRHAESDLVNPEMDNALHILSDQIQRVIDSAGMLSQINAGLLDIYANSQGNRMNDIMRTLTVFSVLTLPVTVISGFYGMNFVFFPGLHWHWAIYITIGTMLLMAGLIWLFCRHKHII